MNDFSKEDHEARIKFCALGLYKALEAIESHCVILGLAVKAGVKVDVVKELVLMSDLAAHALDETERFDDGR